ncbi:SusC/RagA family TonB-linked outer membrane protein [Gaoshiqia sediminis]|uniref:TonB-dependent receptor n=1 Tax=Gaoshiqia sediminis TaxID=2986998 RepID=A0AA41Y4V0_9BACT|nr:TonB-dependent receptor [Gaoshiqia sediminis]MCW0481875.1 TonB-dependent receptor [Gaoshiqia sediminis]
MKLTFLFSFLVFVTSWGNSYSQMTSLNVKLKDVPVRDFIQFIEDETDFFFLYQDEVFQKGQKVTIQSEGGSLDYILNQFAEQAGITYEVTDRQIILKGNANSSRTVITMQQNVTVTGVVSGENGEPIPGATVVVKGTSNGTITDFDGKYSLGNVPADATLQFSFVGMKLVEIPVSGRTQINATLQEETIGLEEVVAIGYGTMRKKDVTGSVASVSGEQLAAVPVSNVAQAIQGRLPGVNVTSQDGRPDAEISIRVRGGGSISQSNDPLILIDGIPGNISDIPADMVENIDVLKDASSTAIFGARGANGVILVTTKRGKEGDVTVSYSGYAKFNTPTGYLDALSPYDYLEQKWGLLDVYFGQTYTTPFQQLWGIGAHTGSNSAGIDAYKNVSRYNLQKDVYNSSFSHNHDLTVTGGTNKTKVIFTVNYLDEDGMKLNSYAKRATASLKLDQKIGEKLKFNLDLRYTDRETMGNEGTTSGYGSALSGSYRFRPIAMEDIKGDLAIFDDSSLGEENFVMDDMYNPVNVIKDRENLTLRQSLRSTAGLNWEIIKGLNARTELTLVRDYTTTKNWRGPTPASGNEESYLNADGTFIYAGDADYRKQDSWSVRWTNTLGYEITLNQIHRINALVGQEITDSGGENMRISGRKFPNNFTRDNAFASISQYGSDLVITSGVSTPSRIQSYFGRANYSLRDKYMVTATFRADGSSNFSPEHRWGYFPAGSIAWRVSQESFMENTRSWLDDLKLRVSYGEVGNDAISADQWSQLWAAETEPRWQMGLDNLHQPSYDLASSQFANRDLKWETTITRNIGLDFTLYNNRLWGSIEVYKNTTKDLLMLTDIPSITGFTTSYANIGQTSNKGVEISVNGVLFKNQDWNISGGANINFNKNNIDELAEGLQSAYGTQFLQSGIPNSDYALQKGKPVGIVMGYQMDGKGFYTPDDFNFDTATGMYTLKDGIADLSSAFVAYQGGLVPAGQQAYPGLPKFVDAFEDGVIDVKDYVEIGNMAPTHTGGFNINVTYKQFDLGMNFNWSYGNDIYNANKLASLYNGNKGGGLYGNKLDIVNDSYTLFGIQNGNLVEFTTPEQLNAANANASLPSTYLQQGYVSDIGIEDGSYLRLNTLTLGYTLPKQLQSKIKANNLRIYGSIYNVFTLSGYSGLDPEVNTNDNMNNARYPTPGLDWGTYPRARQFVLGLNVTF